MAKVFESRLHDEAIFKLITSWRPEASGPRERRLKDGRPEANNTWPTLTVIIRRLIVAASSERTAHFQHEIKVVFI